MSSAIALGQLLSQNTMVSAPELAESLDAGAIRCLACGHRCKVLPGRSGVCRVRFNTNGTLHTPAGYVAGVQVDPIEKKPFFHAFPGRDALSFGMLGCDLHCSYCQNWVTSQALRDEEAVSQPAFVDPERLIALAKQSDAPVMVSTYNEPLITADWAVEIFKLAKAEGLRCGFVSNGNATPEVLAFIRPYVDLYKVDLKSFSDTRYRQLGGALQNVLDTIKRLYEMGFWVEIVTLTIPGFNDGDDELTQMADFLAGVSVDIPWHVTAFRPNYKMTGPGRTPAATLLHAREIGRAAGLRYVYAGNAPGRVGDTEDTFCPTCATVLIQRTGFYVEANHIRGGKCPSCASTIPGIWEDAPPRSTTGLGTPVRVNLKSAEKP